MVGVRADRGLWLYSCRYPYMTLVHIHNFVAGFGPRQSFILLIGVLQQLIAQWIVLHDRSDLVSHLIDVPEIDFQAVLQYFANARLVTDQSRGAIADGFQRR